MAEQRKAMTIAGWALAACLCGVAPSLMAAPPAPGNLMPEIQSEFARLYDLPDAMLALQLGPMLETFPEYRDLLMKYLAQGASPARKELLAEQSKGTKKELAAWFATGNHTSVVATAATAGVAAVLLADHSGGGRHHNPPAVTPPVVVPPPPVVTPPVVIPPIVTPPVVVTPPPVVVPPVVVAPPPGPTPESFETNEFNHSPQLNAMGAQYAYARGGTGKGIVVSVDDTGVNINDPELKNQIAPGGSTITDGPNAAAMSDPGGHGTNVAKVLAGERNDSSTEGVAYDAQIVPIRTISVNGSQTLSDADRVDREIEYGVRVSNNSWETGQIADISDGGAGLRAEYADVYKKGEDAGIVYVFAAGNSGNTNTSALAALPLYAPELKGQWLAVVGVDQDQNSRTYGALDPESDRCGAASAWCLAASWNPIISYDDSTGGYSYGLGTSFAAPQVSGAIAVLMQLFPTLTSAQIVQRLLQSANKTGIYADQDLYGQGLLDLKAASAPIGGLAIETTTGQIVALSSASIAGSSAMGDAIRKSLGKVNLVLKDRLDTPFTVSGSTLASASGQPDQTRVDSGAYLERFSDEYRTDSLVTPGGMHLNLTGGVEGGSGLESLGHVQAWQDLSHGVAFSAGMNTNPSWNQGLLRAQPALQSASVTQAFDNPYLSISEQASGVGLNWQIANNWHSSVQVHMAKEGEHVSTRPTNDQQQSLQAEWGYTSPSGLAASVQVGYLNEQQRLLGGESESLLGSGGTRTLFNGLSLNMPLTNQWSLFGRYNSGTSQLHGSGWADSANLRSNSFTLGSMVNATSRLQVGALAYQPLRVSGGNVATNLPTGLASDNSVTWNKVNLGATPDGHHMEYEAFMRYKVPVTGLDLNVKGSLLRIEDYDNQAGNNDTLLLLSAGLRY